MARVFVPVGAREYARLYHVSERTARRRIAGSDRSSRELRGHRRAIMLVPATEYARMSGKSVSAIYRAKNTVREAKPAGVKRVTDIMRPGLREDWIKYVKGRRQGVDTAYVDSLLDKAEPDQLALLRQVMADKVGFMDKRLRVRHGGTSDWEFIAMYGGKFRFDPK